jgi:catechol 2,3-dioxygenase-like lactoylglutathione lyase family enzyme
VRTDCLINIDVADLEEAIAFYEQGVGLRLVRRPAGGIRRPGRHRAVGGIARRQQGGRHRLAALARCEQSRRGTHTAIPARLAGASVPFAAARPQYRPAAVVSAALPGREAHRPATAGQGRLKENAMSEPTTFTVHLEQKRDYLFEASFEQSVVPDILIDEPLGAGEGPPIC